MSETSIETKPSGKAYRYYVLGVLTMTYFFSYVDRQILSILIDDIGRDFAERGIEITDMHKGFLMGTGFALFYATLGIPIARLADRVNRKNIISGAIVIWSFFTAVCGLATGFWSLLFARFGVAIGEAGASPPAHSMIADYFKKSELSRALAIYTSATTFGIVFAFLGGAWISQLFDWRTTFYVVAAPGILLGILLFFTVKEPKRGAQDSVKADKQGNFNQSLSSLMRNKPYVGSATAHTLQTLVGYVLISWSFIIFIRTFGLTKVETGQYLAGAIFIGGLLGLMIGGNAADKLGEKDARWMAWVPAIGTFFCAPALAYAMFQTTPMAMAVWIGIGVFFFNIAFAPAFGIVQTVVKANERSLASAFVFLGANLFGLGLGPLVAGVISDFLKPTYGAVSLNYSLAILTLFLVMASAVFLWTAKHLKGYKRDAKVSVH